MRIRLVICENRKHNSGVSFAAIEKAGTGEIYEKISLNFHPNRKLTGIYEGNQEGENYYAAWDGEIRGQFDEHDVKNLENRTTGLSDVTEFEPEQWSEYNLVFNPDETSSINDTRTYKLVEISKITKQPEN